MLFTALAEYILRLGVLIDIGFSDSDILVKVGISFEVFFFLNVLFCNIF